MTKLVGLVGVSGSGKTTIGEYFADAENVTFVKTTVSQIYKRLGKDPKVAMTLDERLDVQEVILKELKQQWSEAYAFGHMTDKAFVITDRTPFCFISYLLAEVSGYGEITEAQNKRVVRYVMDCQIAALMFDCVFHLPLPTYKWGREDDSKVCATTSDAYNLHYDFILRGLLTGHQVHPYFIETMDLKGRLAYVNDILTQRSAFSV